MTSQHGFWNADQLSERARKVVATVLGVPLDRVGHDTSSASLPEWDSLNHLNIILSLEEEFGVSLSPGETGEMTDIAGIVRILRMKTRGSS